MARKSSGRQKVEMVKMKKESNLQVTFSKRRAGLFKKASELCTLTGADVAILVFSPGKKVFSFGHPGVDTIVDRFLSQSTPPQSSSTMQQLIDAHRNENVRDLNMQLTQVLHELELEKKRGEELKKMIKANEGRCWWEAPVQELNLSQLEQLKASLEELEKNITKQAENLLFQISNQPPPPHLFASTSSNVGVHHHHHHHLNLNIPSNLDHHPGINGGFDPNINVIPPGFERGFY